MNPQCSIWIEQAKFDKIIEKIRNHDEADPLYDGHIIEELYINSHDGSMEGFISIEEIGVSIWIPFGDWFSNFIKYKAFEDLTDFLEEHQETVQNVIDKTQGVINLVDSLSDTVTNSSKQEP